MSKKLTVVLSSLVYPITMARFFWEAFERRDDCDVHMIGPYFQDYIPWNGGIKLDMKYVKAPDMPLPREAARTFIHPQMVVDRLPKNIDLFLQIDAGWHFATRPPGQVVALVQTDPHCVSGDTLIATDCGIMYVDELVDTPIQVADQDGMTESSGVVHSGMQVTRRIILEGGYEIVCTDDHLIQGMKKDVVGYIPAKNLQVGDCVHVVRGTYSPKTGTPEDYSIGFVLGAFQGDGSFGSSDIIKFTIGKERKYEFGEAIKFHLQRGFGIDTVTEGKHYTNENTKILQVRRWGLHRFLKSLSIKSGNVPRYIRTGTKELFAGYVAGLLAADGCSAKGLIQITTKHEMLAKELQIMLAYFGILSRRKSIITNESSYKPGETYWNLYINAGQSTVYLADLVGYIPGKPININSRHRGEVDGKDQWMQITDIRGSIKNYPHLRCPEPVYDVTNCVNNGAFLANGIHVHNCLKYDVPKSYSDYSFCMQTPYMHPGDIYLPYALDDVHFYPEERPMVHDAALIGLHYEQRTNLVNRLRQRGLDVYYDIGVVYDDYRNKYNESKVALCWSSLQDLPVRVWEAMGMARPLVVNRNIPDLHNFFVEGEHYLGFDTIEEAEKQVRRFLDDPDFADRVRWAAYRKVVDGKHLWSDRVQQILETCKLVW